MYLNFDVVSTQQLRESFLITFPFKTECCQICDSADLSPDDYLIYFDLIG